MFQTQNNTTHQLPMPRAWVTEQVATHTCKLSSRQLTNSHAQTLQHKMQHKTPRKHPPTNPRKHTKHTKHLDSFSIFHFVFILISLIQATEASYNEPPSPPSPPLASPSASHPPFQLSTPHFNHSDKASTHTRKSQGVCMSEPSRTKPNQICLQSHPSPVHPTPVHPVQSSHPANPANERHVKPNATANRPGIQASK